MSLTNLRAVTASLWMNNERWQSPKSSPQILMFLSADPDTSSVLSLDISKLSTGNLCPYNDKKNLSVFAYKI